MPIFHFLFCRMLVNADILLGIHCEEFFLQAHSLEESYAIVLGSIMATSASEIWGAPYKNNLFINPKASLLSRSMTYESFLELKTKLKGDGYKRMGRGIIT